MNLLKKIKLIYGLIKYTKRPNRSDFKSCGKFVLVHDLVRIYNPENIDIHDEVYIGPRCTIYGYGGISIGKGCVLGENVTIISSNHNYDSENLTLLPFDEVNIIKKVEIQDYAWIGQNTTILPGVKISSFSVIGAGSVLTKNTEPNGIYAGNPAKLIKFRKNHPYKNAIKTWVSIKKSNHFI